MGNCFTTKVDNHTSTTTKSPTPGLPLSDLRCNFTCLSTEDSHPQVAVVGVYGRKDSVVCVDTGGQGEGREDLPSSGKIATARSLKRFTLAELTAATKNFHPESVIGEGGFGKVFKGWVDEKTYAPSKPGVGMPVAVKKSNSDSYQTLREWKAEVQFLGKFSHPNLVNLLGYCWEEGQFLLVYEYMQEGSLESHLFGRRTEILSWETRLKIAIGAAQGLAFLHSSENCVIYRDFKTSNILLDAACNSKLSDFGLARTGPTNGHSHVTTRLIGTHGYAAPEYLATGHLYMKSDVYGFGVVLLELLTGLKAVDSNRPGDRHNLVDWMRPFLADKRKLKKIIDPKLDDRFPHKGVFWTAQLILKCLQRETKNRPSMEQVLVTLQSIKTIKKMSPEN